jgi:uncharacterized protein (TIGR02646 family)
MIAINSYFDDVITSLSEAYLSKKRYKTTKNKKKPNNPEGRSWLDRLMLEQQKHEADRTVYGAKEVKDKLISIFNNKCAYCECDTSAGSAYDAEHFRPIKHYYWLAYEWTNLLLSCRTCNTIHKRTHFPLEKETNRLKNHPIQLNGTFDKAACHILSDGLMAEKPLLLHPAIDKPMEHFIFLKDGNVKYLTEKGRQSIQIYGLDRPELIKCRGDMVLTIQERILSEYLENPLPSEKRIKIEVTKILKELTLYKQANKPFTGFVSAILDYFNEFIIDNEDLLGIPLPNQAIMKIAVKEFFEKQFNNP